MPEQKSMEVVCINDDYNEDEGEHFWRIGDGGRGRAGGEEQVGELALE